MVLGARGRLPTEQNPRRALWALAKRGDEIRRQVAQKCIDAFCGCSGPPDTAAYTRTWEIDGIFIVEGLGTLPSSRAFRLCCTRVTDVHALGFLRLYHWYGAHLDVCSPLIYIPICTCHDDTSTCCIPVMHESSEGLSPELLGKLKPRHKVVEPGIDHKAL